MFSAWKEVYETLYYSNAFFFIMMTSIFAASVFQWRYERRKKPVARLFVIGSYALAALSLLAALLSSIILYNDFPFFIYGVVFAYTIYRIMFW